MTRNTTNATNATRTNKRNAKTNELPTIELKSIYRDIMNDNPTSTLTTKKMRARLRVELRDEHIHNASWVFTQSRAHDIRCMFDVAYRERHERANARNAKRNAKTNDAPKTTRKARAKTNDVVNVDATTNDATNDANA